MTKDDKIIWGKLITIRIGRPVVIQGIYLKNYKRDLDVKHEVLFKDTKLVVPAAIRGLFSSQLNEIHPGQFGMKLLAEYIWLPHIFRERYHLGESCNQCLEVGKNLKVLLGTEHTTKRPTLFNAI